MAKNGKLQINTYKTQEGNRSSLYNQVCEKVCVTKREKNQTKDLIKVY